MNGRDHFAELVAHLQAVVDLIEELAKSTERIAAQVRRLAEILGEEAKDERP